MLAQVKDHITRLAKKGATPSSIGVTLRDSHGIAQVSIDNHLVRRPSLKAQSSCIPLHKMNEQLQHTWESCTADTEDLLATECRQMQHVS